MPPGADWRDYWAVTARDVVVFAVMELVAVSVPMIVMV